MVKRKRTKRANVGQQEAAPARRGGRKPGTWKLVTPEQLSAYRQEHKVSRARLAQVLGVSTTSVQNWETGTVASLKIQQRLAEIIAAGPTALPLLRKEPSLWELASGARTERASPEVVATGSIVAQYVTTRADVSTEELVALIRSVRHALNC